MKSVFEKLSAVKEDAHDDFHMGATIAVILLFLTFIGASFYLLVDTYA